MSAFEGHRIEPIPGDGLVIATDTTVAVVAAGGDEAITGSIVATVTAEAGAALVRSVASIVMAHGGDVPDVGLVTAHDDGCAVFLAGSVTATLEGVENLDGSTATLWVDRVLEDLPAAGVIALTGEPGGPDPMIDLRSGVVPGSGVRLQPRGLVESPTEADGDVDRPAVTEPEPVHAPEPEPAREPEPVHAPEPEPEPEPASEPEPMGAPPSAAESPPPPDEAAPAPIAARDFTVLTLDAESAPHRDPLPILTATAAPEQPEAGPPVDEVNGVLCVDDHLNPPGTELCTRCGARIGVDQTIVIVSGPRPTLGMLILDDGTTIQVRHRMVIGRDPSGDETVAAGTTVPVVLTDDEKQVSRVHATIELDEWDAYLVDLASANGTWVERSDGDDWTRLDDDERFELETGARFRLGTRSIQFSHHHRQ